MTTGGEGRDKLGMEHPGRPEHGCRVGFDPPVASGHSSRHAGGTPSHAGPLLAQSRIAARILLRQEAGRLTARDIRLARLLAEDKGVTSRLIDQALYGFYGRANRLAAERRAAA